MSFMDETHLEQVVANGVLGRHHQILPWKSPLWQPLLSFWYLSKAPGQMFKMCWPLPDCINEGFH